MYENWFLDYASYVILERAVPALFDGLKPVQRRILHSMKRLDDGRFNKVANIIGHTMQFHPHGDAAIGDAIVNLGQKDLMIETQGNWGDVRTGDGAAAPRYIEARLSKFALEVAFNPQTTHWQSSYDGRQKEPVHLPVKFPLVLAQGAEGIAVGLATRIMPHNFNELLEASISILEGKPVNILPDFPTGGLADFANYNGGQRGGKIRLRSIIDSPDRKTLIVRSVPYGITSTALIDSIIKANENGKIKIKHVVDNTAKDVEIVIDLPPGVSPDVTIDALYAFTNCEVSISPNCCVIVDDKPMFLGVNELLKISTENTVQLLKWELENQLADLSEKLFFSSLEKIFIENRIYRDIEECETWEAVISTIDKGLEPFKPKLLRAVTEEDIIKLTEIKIKRISKYNSFKADEIIKGLEDEIKQVKHNLKYLTEYAIDYFRRLQKKYGAGRERKTIIRSFDNIEVTQVALANQKLYINRAEGFIGYGLKKDEYVSECSDIDDIIVFLKDGRFIVTRIAAKTFTGKDIIHAAVWKKGDERTIYNMIYYDAKSKRNYAKRFAITSITRDKHYDLTKGAEGSKVLYFTANPNSESEIVTVYLSPSCRARKKSFDFDFGELEIKGRGAQGNILTKWPVRKVTRREVGASSLGGVDIYYDETVGRLNTDARGKYLGNFDNGGKILVIYKDGTYELTGYELTNRYDTGNVIQIEQFNLESVISAVHYDGEKENFYVKRFNIETQSAGKMMKFIGENSKSRLVVAATDPNPVVELEYLRGRMKEKVTQRINLNDIVEVKGWKARGNLLSNYRVTYVGLVQNEEPEIEIAPVEPGNNDTEEPEQHEEVSDNQMDLFG
ncbi:MAG: DNA gyrase/topoisomerase IV subunit A [Calditrichaceae bacterium]|nr:DNA gyrase/topoisomerase IV subunit A [Calditrichaceae bacterium]MBN2710765.1 DNA gyrase/topoisomerase IV subunit A [Calditrichaceae bacterium]